ncbi:hypothetical protein GIB67_014031 [Kingdonia uniflora]|uniref:Diacylglycerol glucosyltransferase N-terminal domain-containing protein n=1 Tax=Kingdonia uniflora TaxID=39325 RepID=A0A7J7L5Q5_9MAGN|nr:hypothetical protein GIB67_014031 [Kingdonia uniflora]
MGSSAVTRDSINLFDVLPKWDCFSLNPKGFYNLGSNGCSSNPPNSLYFDRIGKPKLIASMGISSISLRIQSFVNQFNRDIRLHCDRIPSIGFGSVSSCGDNNGVKENGNVLIGEEGLNLNGFDAKKSKKILILMSDTGGGHRASAEAIKSAFNEEYGDEYQVFVTDLWSEHTPWPFNQLPRSYNFLVKHGPLWKMTYYGTAPRLVHQSNFAATSAFIAREVAKGLMQYKPDIIISVHPLMQHVPLRVLKSKGLLEKIVFTTVITDLSTCHPTWFHKLVTRCYCPTTEVAKRATKAGLQPSQIKVYGLPVRPSFVKPVRPKIGRRVREEKESEPVHGMPFGRCGTTLGMPKGAMGAGRGIQGTQSMGNNSNGMGNDINGMGRGTQGLSSNINDMGRGTQGLGSNNNGMSMVTGMGTQGMGFARARHIGTSDLHQIQNLNSIGKGRNRGKIMGCSSLTDPGINSQMDLGRDQQARHVQSNNEPSTLKKRLAIRTWVTITSMSMGLITRQFHHRRMVPLRQLVPQKA